jgi:hypothetical protein
VKHSVSHIQVGYIPDTIRILSRYGNYTAAIQKRYTTDTELRKRRVKYFENQSLAELVTICDQFPAIQISAFISNFRLPPVNIIPSATKRGLSGFPVCLNLQQQETEL